MDYRYYDGGHRFKIPPKLRRHLHRLRPLGTMFMISGMVIPFLMLVKILVSTYFLNFLTFGLIILGPILYLVGMVFDSTADRAQ